jgi:hypothetical protein
MPVVSMRSSVVRCAAAPMPLEAKVSCPGFDFASSTSSFGVLTGSELVTHTMRGAVTRSDTGAKLLIES